MTAGPKKSSFVPYLVNPKHTLIIPTLVLYEVRKKLLWGQLKTAADWFVSEALRHTMICLDERLAIEAANVSLQFRMAMADAIIYATAEVENAQVVTGDSHFANLPKVTIL